MSSPDEYTPDRAEKLEAWVRNRAHTSGADAVKRGGTTYLPLLEPEQPIADYRVYVAETEYFPAAATTLRSFAGLVFRKKSEVRGPELYLPALESVSQDGKTLEEVARWAFAEYAITNDGGVLVDYPPAGQKLSFLTRAQKERMKKTPFIATYKAETIREITHATIEGRKTLVKVRLAETEDRVRELELVAGQYVQRVWTKTDAGWSRSSDTVPEKNGQPLDYIPFYSFSDGSDVIAFNDICAANQVHYMHSGKLASALRWVSKPIIIQTGVEKDNEQLKVRAGTTWRFSSTDADVKFLEYKGDGIPGLERFLSRVADNMAALGSRMLAAEKAAAEAAETVARRQASENSILASMARHVSNQLQKAIKEHADWSGYNPTDISYALNTDFVPVPIDPQLLGQVIALINQGKMPDKALFDILQKGEVLSETEHYEDWKAEIDSIEVDVPPVTIADPNNPAASFQAPDGE